MAQILDMSILVAVTKSLNRIKRENKAPIDYWHGISEEDLKLITSLSVENNSRTNIEEFKSFPNLKHLTINFESQEKLWGGSTENQIKIRKEELSDSINYSIIENLENLESLSIVGQPNLREFDVTKLQKLHSLEFINNDFFKKVIGLNTLHNLITLNISGGKGIEAFDFNEVRKNNENLQTCIFDMKMYPDFMKKSLNFQRLVEYRNIIDDYNFLEVKWIDRHSQRDTVASINAYKAAQVYKKAQQIMKEYTSPELSDYENVYGLYNYIIRNVKYDYEALNKGQEKKKYRIYSDITTSQADSTRSSYQAIMQNKAVCAGYANLMVFLGKVAGIDCEYVNCESKQAHYSDVSNTADHAIVKIKIADKTYYCDPTWDAARVQRSGTFQLKDFLKNKEEISANHKLFYLEANEQNSTALTQEERQTIANNYHAKMQQSISQPSGK